MLLLFWAVLQLHSVQTFFAQKVVTYFASELGVEMKVERLSIDFFDTIELHHLYVEDEKQDTLVYFSSLGVEIDEIDFSKELISASLHLNEAVIKINRQEGAEKYNFEFINELFSAEGTSKNAYNFNIAGLTISDGSFTFNDFNYEQSDSSFDEDNLVVNELNLSISEFTKTEKEVNLTIDHLSLKEEKGFELENLKAGLKIKESDFIFKDLVIQTPQTELLTDIQFKADSLHHFRDFNEKVIIQSSFQRSLIGIDDIAFFAPAIEGIDYQVYFDGEVNGTIANLSGENVEIQLNQETIMVGDFDLRGLPEVEETFIALDLDELRTSAEGLKKLPYPPFNEDNHIPIPQSFDTLGMIYFSGNFTGYYNDFVAYGDFTTQLGDLKTDLSLKEIENNEIQYKGNVSSTGFEIGKLLSVKDLDELSFDLEVDGTGLSAKTVNAKAKGKINSIVYRDYNYRNIDINGQVFDQNYKGEVVINDKNLDLAFDGEIAVNRADPITSFVVEVNKANLGKLNLFNLQDSLTQLRFNANLDVVGNGVDNLVGKAVITDMKYQDSKLEHQMDQLSLNLQKQQDLRQINLNSNLFNAEMKGAFKFKEVQQAFMAIANQNFHWADFENSEFEYQEFEFSALFKNVEPLTEVFFPDLVIDSATNISGRLSNVDSIAFLRLESPQMRYGELKLEDFTFDVQMKKDSLETNLESNSLKLFELTDFKTFALNSSLFKGENSTKIEWTGINKRDGEGRINIWNEMESLDKMKINFRDSYFTINDSTWRIAKDNKVWIDSTTINIEKLSMYSRNQGLFVGGTISKDSSKNLDVSLNNLDLDYLSSLFPEEIISILGIANGKAQMRDAYHNLTLTSDIQIEGLEVNNIEIGNAAIKSGWKSGKKALDVVANLGERGEEVLQIKGEIYPFELQNSLNLLLKMNDFPVALVEPYIEDYLTELDGLVSGKAKIRGLAREPILNGSLNLKEVGLRVNYLNTTYSINDEVIIQPDFIGFNLIDIYDSRGNKAVATGTFFHSNYDNFNLDIGLEFKEFFTLNTTAEDNDLYYGTVISSGSANISGYADQLIFEMDLKAEKGTDFKIPLTEDVDVSSSNFVIFTNSPDYQKTDEEPLDLSGIQLNFDLEIIPDAKVQIIFDEQIGDIIKAQGAGNLKLEINTLGNFNIYGQYIVEKGDYLFTLKNIVSKKFDLAKGSRIFWDGDPYQAQIDMQAIYNLRASLYDLFPEDSTAGFRRRIPVELELQMNSYLLSPEIGFDIRLPTADENTKRKLESVLYVNNNDVNRQEMNQQVFGLLMLNRFMPSASAATVTGGYDRGPTGLNNGYEFLSNQLSNWFSRLSDQFDVGVNYRPANELNSSEVDLSVSTEILNDRLILDGNLGYVGNSTQYEQDLTTQSSNFIGEFSAEYKLSQDGRFRVKGFNRSTQNSLLQFNSPYTQGVGLFYREEFDSMRELWKKYFNSKK